ncbi:MAG TPA: hypothetical protein VI316_12185 [Candidatus Dormibacteraeota bacterium]
MGTPTAEQTREQLELTRRSIERNVDRVVARIRYELDWRARLRRDGAQIAAIGGAIVATSVLVVVLRRTLRTRKDGYAIADFDSMDLKDVATELRAIKQELEKQRDGGGAVAKLAYAAVGSAAGAAGRAAAARLLGEEEPGGGHEGPRPA